MNKKKKKTIKNNIVYYIAKSLLFFSSAIPRPFGLFLFGRIGALIFIFDNSEKRRVLRNLNHVFGHKWDDKKIKAVAKKVYVNYGKNIFDAVYLTSCSTKKFFSIVKYNNLDGLKNAYDKGNGIVGITQHMGCFEINIHLLAKLGFKSFSIGQELKDPRLDRLIGKMRERNGIIYLHRKKSARKILKYLKEGRVFGVLADYNTGLDGVFCNFCGKISYSATAPLRIALKSDIPIVVAYSRRKKDDTHEFILHGPLLLEKSGDIDRDLVINMQKINDLLTESIMEAPEQWVWSLKKWNKNPEKNEEILSIKNYH